MQKADLISRVNRDRPGGHFSWSKTQPGKWWRRHDRKIARRQQKAIATEAIDTYYREDVPVMELEASLEMVEAEWERELMIMHDRAMIEDDDLDWEEEPSFDADGNWQWDWQWQWIPTYNAG